uniref:Cell division protein FtsX n=1 Tax=Candidatus Kentrum sp. TC TaxID=2126339 RepID=A0A450YKL2_9GAMM|nr:MAG: cell division transport system permease protein [Candidatus Kentron sp. TC]VFK42461.1 MAG: cell division transport system permease protein [Candidatus Kentron sp. TC]VFK59763.1 MAG: cell division transport system permease protein [Candidatus Kentron sp. TC]
MTRGGRLRDQGRFVASNRGIGARLKRDSRAILAGLGQSTHALFITLERAFGAWAMRHLQVIFATLGQLVGAPIATLMTGAVIGVALALPAGLYVLLENAREISRGWEGAAQISLFLEIDETDDEARVLAEELQKQYPQLERVRVITRSQALAEYRELSGFDAAIEALGGENPLPAVLVLYPTSSYSNPTDVQFMLDELQRRDEVESVQFDLQWLKRLYTMMEIIRRGVLGLAVLLALGVLLIVGNTIRLGIWNHREEIEIARLFGASDAFIRRPFLYTGLWYGLLGGMIAWIFVAVFFGFLLGPIDELVALYYGKLSLIFPWGDLLSILLMAGALLGLSGSWFAVGRHLDDIQPS